MLPGPADTGTVPGHGRASLPGISSGWRIGHRAGAPGHVSGRGGCPRPLGQWRRRPADLPPRTGRQDDLLLLALADAPRRNRADRGRTGVTCTNGGERPDPTLWVHCVGSCRRGRRRHAVTRKGPTLQAPGRRGRSRPRPANTSGG